MKFYYLNTRKHFIRKFKFPYFIGDIKAATHFDLNQKAWIFHCNYKWEIFK